MRSYEIFEDDDFSPSPFGSQYVANASEADQIRQVTVSPDSIQYIKHPSEAVQLAAVRNKPLILYKIKNPTEAVIRYAVKKDPVALIYIDHPSKEIQKIGILSDVMSLLYIEVEDISPMVINQCKQEIIKGLLNSIAHTNSSHDELLNIVFTLNEFVDWPELEIIKQSLIHELKNGSDRDTEELDESADEEEKQIIAVQNDWKYIKKIPNPSEAVQLAAVKSKVTAIKYIKNPTPAVQIAACKKSGKAIQYIKYPTVPAQLAAISRDPNSYRWINNPNLSVQTAIIKKMAAADHIGARYSNVYYGFFLDIWFSKEAISQNKKELITIMLKAIKHDQLYVAGFFLEKLKNTKWPELEIIRNSLDAIEKEKRANGYYDLDDEPDDED